MKLLERTEQVAREAYYQALAAQIAGGKIELLTEGGLILATLQLPTDLAIASHEGFVYYDIEDVEVKEMGKPTSFRVISNDGSTLLTGTIGTDSNNVDMPIDPKDETLYPGMKFGLEEFALTPANTTKG